MKPKVGVLGTLNLDPVGQKRSPLSGFVTGIGKGSVFWDWALNLQDLMPSLGRQDQN